MIDGDTIEASVACARPHATFTKVWQCCITCQSGKSGIKELDDAQRLMLRAQQRLKQALAKIQKTQPGAAPAAGQIQ
jgi:hypothetical protein